MYHTLFSSWQPILLFSLLQMGIINSEVNSVVFKQISNLHLIYKAQSIQRNSPKPTQYSISIKYTTDLYMNIRTNRENASSSRSRTGLALCPPGEKNQSHQTASSDACRKGVSSMWSFLTGVWVRLRQLVHSSPIYPGRERQ